MKKYLFWSGVAFLLFFPLLMTVILAAQNYLLHQKMNLLLEVQQISQFPTGEACIAAKGKPAYQIDGEEFESYSIFTNLKDRKFMADKLLYCWGAPLFRWLIVVTEKDSDRVCLVTHYPM